MTALSSSVISHAGEYLTPAEIARMLRLSKMTVYRLIDSGELAGLRIGRQFRVPRTSLDAYVERNTTGAQ